MTNHTPTALAERAALQANGDAAKADNLKALAQLDATADSAQQAAHIRGVVATTMEHLLADATAATRHSAAQWQTWALGLSDERRPAV
jgi:ubiquinone biosynthesis protein UbiJ